MNASVSGSFASQLQSILNIYLEFKYGQEKETADRISLPKYSAKRTNFMIFGKRKYKERSLGCAMLSQLMAEGTILLH